MLEGTRAGERAAVRRGLRFRERMAGTVAFGCSDALVSAQLGDARGDEMTLRLKVEIDDVDAFLAERQHRSLVSGSVDCEILGGVLPIERGSVKLLPGNRAGRARTMEYWLDFADRTGRELTLLGTKTVRNDPGLDLWRATTILDVWLFPRQHHLNGSRPNGTLVLSGRLRPSLLPFLLPFLLPLRGQLSALRATATTPPRRVQTVLAFGGFFLRRLAEVHLRAPDPERPSPSAAGVPVSRPARGTGSSVSEFTEWPHGEQPKGAKVFVHNERIVPAPPERVWNLLVAPQGWSEFYANAWFVALADPRQHRLQHGSVFRWVTFGLPITCEVDICQRPLRIGWRWWGTGAHGYHIWVLEPHECGTRVVTEETQRGVLPGLTRPILRPLMLLGHGYWLRQLACRASRPPELIGTRGALPQP